MVDVFVLIRGEIEEFHIDTCRHDEVEFILSESILSIHSSYEKAHAALPNTATLIPFEQHRLCNELYLKDWKYQGPCDTTIYRIARMTVQ